MQQPRQYGVMSALFALFLLGFVLTLLAPGGDEGLVVIGDIFYVTFSAIAALTGYLAVRRYGTRSLLGKTVLLVEVMVVLDFIGGFVWMVYQEAFGVINPFPSIADIPWVLFYVMGIVAFLYPLHKARWPLSAKRIIVVLVAATVLVVMAYQGIIRVILADEGLTTMTKWLSVAYPVGGVLLLLAALLLFFALKDTSLGSGWLAFVLAAAAYGTADLLFTYMEGVGTYVTGSFVDILYYLAQILFTLGFLAQLAAGKNE